MTAIQKISIPLLLSNSHNKKYDLIGCSDTGSGKTLSFLIPSVNSIISSSDLFPFNSNHQLTPSILILSPTRELAEQINSEAKKLIFNTGLHSVSIYGGVKMYEQNQRLSYGCEILVATPGRLIDCLKKGRISLSQVKVFIIDEADVMLDMGFIQQIKEIIYNFDLPDKNKRTTLLFSATFEKEVKILSETILKDYFFISNGTESNNKSDENDEKTDVFSRKLIKNKENIEQVIVPSTCFDYKINFINETANKYISSSKEMKGMIVFVDKKDKVDMITQCLNKKGVKSIGIHGDKPQFERENAIKRFKNGEFLVIVATNILCRGIDFVHVDYIFNFDLPMNIDDYIHRIGRVGRLGNKGFAVSFIEKDDKFKKITRDIIFFMRKCLVNIPNWLSNLYPNDSFGVPSVIRKETSRKYNDYTNPHSISHGERDRSREKDYDLNLRKITNTNDDW